MLKYIDNFLNSITMYRCVLYGLLIISGVAVAFGFLGILSFSGLSLILSLTVLYLACRGFNLLFSRIFNAPTNVESASITSLILFLILAPTDQVSAVGTLIAAAGISMGTKYLFAIHKKHLFNPAAIALVILNFWGSGQAIWWVGSGVLLPVVAVIGLLIVRKIRRFHLFFSFMASAVAMILIFGTRAGLTLSEALTQGFSSWPLIFFATIMLTEPFTTPPRKKLQVIYGLIVGLLFGTPFAVGPVYSTPELALVIGNIFSYLVSSKQRLRLRLQKKEQLTPEMYNFSFTPDEQLVFKPGQYLEWTLPHQGSDSRGNRRYFTIASSPTETEISLGVKIVPDQSSSFKKALLELTPGQEVLATQLAGDFTLPAASNQKLAFIAGGIGITPFRSMVKYLIDTKQQRDIVLFYVSSTNDGFAYKEVFDQAKKVGLKTVYVITQAKNIPKNWTGQSGYISAEMIHRELSDYAERTFYLSGPNAMVSAYKDLLRKLNIGHAEIVTDYFPGF